MKELNRTCNNCKTHNLIYDEYKGEIFCKHCGVIDTNIYELIKITEFIKSREKREKITDITINYKLLKDRKKENVH